MTTGRLEPKRGRRDQEEKIPARLVSWHDATPVLKMTVSSTLDRRLPTDITTNVR